ncbi:MAG: hypothetical protein ACLPTZ_20415 [Beijerinckiaceae bacterium]|jgi:hypothetical protein
MRVLTIIARYGTDKYAGAVEDVEDMFARQMPEIEHRTIVVDNALPTSHRQAISERILLIGGNNIAREFSGWDCGIGAAGADLDRYDFIHLATSAFRTLYVCYLDLIDMPLLRALKGRAAALGHIDYYFEPVTLLTFRPQHWLRTACVFLPPVELRTLGSLVSIGPESHHRFFSGDPAAPFRESAPLCGQYRTYILDWLTGKGTGQGVEWHSRFTLSHDSLREFEAKTLTILNEQMFAVRLRAQGCRIADVTWAWSELGRRGALPKPLPPWRIQLSERAHDAVPLARSAPLPSSSLLKNPSP